MIRTILVIIITLLFTSSSFAQVTEQLKVYKDIYHKSDSLKKLEIPFSIDSSTFISAVNLDKQHPVKYFEHTGELIRKSKYNDAAFIYYLGVLRYRYYNSANPNFKAGGDGALAASLQYVFGETINLYLKNNIDYFIEALKTSSGYFTRHDYTFFPKKKNPEKYNSISESFSGLIKDVETNREKYQKEWDAEMRKMIDSINETIEQYNKMSPEEKEN